MTQTARGTFDVELTPGSPELEGSVGRFDMRKTFHGDLEGAGVGVMLSAGDPQSGSAGYVAIETVTGSIGGHAGRFVFQQFATMTPAGRELRYEIVPGSGSGELSGIQGALTLTIDPEGTHHYELAYEL